MDSGALFSAPALGCDANDSVPNNLPLPLAGFHPLSERIRSGVNAPISTCHET
jgi:hypothetical protein